MSHPCDCCHPEDPLPPAGCRECGSMVAHWTPTDRGHRAPEQMGVLCWRCMDKVARIMAAALGVEGACDPDVPALSVAWPAVLALYDRLTDPANYNITLRQAEIVLTLTDRQRFGVERR